MTGYCCRWRWCSRFFEFSELLNAHVVEEHVRVAIAVRRRDIATLLRVEEGVGETLSDRMFLNFIFYVSTHKSIALPSQTSLPSPPQSPQLSFAALASPNCNPDLKIPDSPSLDDLVHRFSQDSTDSALIVAQHLTQSDEHDGSPVFSSPSRQTWYQSPSNSARYSSQLSDFSIDIPHVYFFQSQAPYQSQ